MKSVQIFPKNLPCGITRIPCKRICENSLAPRCDFVDVRIDICSSMSAASVLFACTRRASYAHHTLKSFLQQFGALFTTADVIYGQCPSVGNAIDQRGKMQLIDTEYLLPPLWVFTRLWVVNDVAR